MVPGRRRHLLTLRSSRPIDHAARPSSSKPGSRDRAGGTHLHRGLRSLLASSAAMSATGLPGSRQ